MLFKQSDLSYNSIQEANNILNESVYLDESELIFINIMDNLFNLINHITSLYFLYLLEFYLNQDEQYILRISFL